MFKSTKILCSILGTHSVISTTTTIPSSKTPERSSIGYSDVALWCIVFYLVILGKSESRKSLSQKAHCCGKWGIIIIEARTSKKALPRERYGNKRLEMYILDYTRDQLVGGSTRPRQPLVLELPPEDLVLRTHPKDHDDRDPRDLSSPDDDKQPPDERAHDPALS